MAIYKRLVVFCLLLISANNVAFGKIRGNPSIELHSSSLAVNEDVQVAREGVRQLNRHKRKNHHKQGKNKHDDDDEEEDDEVDSKSGKKGKKGGDKSSKSGKSGKKGSKSGESEKTAGKQKGGGKIKGETPKSEKKGGKKHTMKMKGKKGNKEGPSNKSADGSDLPMPSGKKAKRSDVKSKHKLKKSSSSYEGTF